MSKIYILISLMFIITSCNTQQKDFEILKLKAIIDSNQLKRSDSLLIYNQIKEDHIYKDVHKLLDSLKIYDNKKYQILLFIASERQFEEGE